MERQSGRAHDVQLQPCSTIRQDHDVETVPQTRQAANGVRPRCLFVPGSHQSLALVVAPVKRMGGQQTIQDTSMSHVNILLW